MSISSIPMEPENSGPLRVLTIGRISTVHQDMQSIEAMYEVVERAIRNVYDGPFILDKLGEQASGLLVDRPTIVEAMTRIEAGRYDVVILEDLSRAYRNPAFQYAFVQDCVDNDTRCICLNDNLDTADENWEISLSLAAVRHGMSIPDTRKRIKRTATHAFEQGGMVMRLVFGYRRVTKEAAEAGTDGPKGLRLAKDPACTPVIREMAQRVLRGDSYPKIAEWLNTSGIKPGPYVQKGRWTGNRVRDLLRNDLLHGERVFRRTLVSTEYRTGHLRRTRNAPENFLRQTYEELAHLSVEEHARLIAAMNERAAGRTNHARGPDSPLFRRPRSRTVFPRQHATCGICGSLVYPVEGIALKCSQACRRQCWNRVAPREPVIRRRVLEAVMDLAVKQAGFRVALLNEIHTQVALLQSKSGQEIKALAKRIAETEKRMANITNAIEMASGPIDVLTAKLETLHKDRDELHKQVAQARAARHEEIGDIADGEIEGCLPEILQHLAAHSYGFADLMRRLIPVFEVHPVQALDTHQVRARARLRVCWTALLDESAGAESGDSGGGGETWLTVDLFDMSQHIADALKLIEQSRPDGSLSKVASALGMTRMRVKRARHYARLMAEAGTDDPYRELTEPPTQASRWNIRGDQTG